MNPELTYSVSKYQTACGIVDVMMHTMERYFTPVPPTPLTDGISESLLRAVIDAGKKVIANPKDYDARATIMWASSLAHNDLTGCGRINFLAVHQLAHALSGEFDHVAHGAGLAVLYPAWAKYIYKHNIPRFAQFARQVWGVNETDDKIAAEKGIKAMADYFAFLGMEQKISDFGVPKTAIEKMVMLCTNDRTRTIKSFILRLHGFNDWGQIFKIIHI